MLAHPEYFLRYVDCHIFGVYDPNYSSRDKDGIAWFLVEDELEGQFLKWNDNKGGVREPLRRMQERTTANEISDMFSGLALVEEDEEEECDEEEDVLGIRNLTRPIALDDVPQAFSHFTYYSTNGRMLVCDIQGVHNNVDGFLLTDPVLHEISHGWAASSGKRRHKNGATDKGKEGIDMFFSTHVCNPVCAVLGLQSHTHTAY